MRVTLQEQYWVWLSSIEGMGPVRFYDILGAFLDIETAFMNAEEIAERVKLPGPLAQRVRDAANSKHLENVLECVERSGVQVLTRLNQEYPKTLAEIDNPPPVLYFRGNLPDVDEMSCGMVGSRRPTKSGINAARALAAGLAAQGVTVVSGMARGIDTACHLGALDVGGKTVAVLGCGADVVYPPENLELYGRIVETGTVISEFFPGTLPTTRNFPQRNRIISGLSQILVAGEGGEKSGARITVDFALKQGRDVYAMSCDMKSSMARLPLYLIEAGAPVAADAADILRDRGWRQAKQSATVEEQSTGNMSRAETVIYGALQKEGLTADELAERTGIAIRDVNMLLTVMELNGLVDSAPGGVFIVNK